MLNIYTITANGYVAVWECGGGYTNSGLAIIVTKYNGLPKKPIYISRHGNKANNKHALFIVKKGDVIITAKRERDRVSITAEQVVDIDTIKKEFINLGSSKNSTPTQIAENMKYYYGPTVTIKTIEQYDNYFLKVCGYYLEPNITTQLLDINKSEFDFTNAIKAVTQKVWCYHCRHMHYGIINTNDKKGD